MYILAALIHLIRLYNVYYKDTSSNSTIIQDSDFSMELNKNGVYVFAQMFHYFKQTNAGVPKITPIFGRSAEPFNKAQPVITIPSGSTSATDTWKIYLYFFNVNSDQSYLAGKTFRGELYIDDVSCT